LPGHAKGVVTLPLGYGRGDAGGVVASGVGGNAYALCNSAHWTGGTVATIAKTGDAIDLAVTQDHHLIQSHVGTKEYNRRQFELLREDTLAHFHAHPDFAAHVIHLPLMPPLWNEVKYDKYKWGMTIDLSTCIGCSACVVACQAENNIPVVGREEVNLGREMHWIRIDRYFRGSPEQADSAEIRHQPVTCVQCENAPCEQVCPVAATVHDSDGLNGMIYNRCIGTRYCSNNCPYKVRRFNWFYNHHGPRHPRSLASDASPEFPLKPVHEKLTPIEMMVFNPEVTVRSRGVMEKCSFCLQRISAARIKLRNQQVSDRHTADMLNDQARVPAIDEHPKLPDGMVQTACQQACPTDAIIFGDLNIKGSRVEMLTASPRSYRMLEELGVKPRLSYLARVSNPAGDDHGSHDSHNGHAGDHAKPEASGIQAH
jgi:molybdopterin-containing oxidoreductase family iron-sulfur binding subunit